MSQHFRTLGVIANCGILVCLTAGVVKCYTEHHTIDTNNSVTHIASLASQQSSQGEQEFAPYIHTEEFHEFWEYTYTIPNKHDTILDCADYKNSDLISLACNIYFEGRGEPLEGQIAIANVTLNRVDANDHSNTVHGVVWENVNNVPQFSWTADGKHDIVKDANAWKRSVTLARFMLEGEAVDVTGGSLYYHKTGLRNSATKWFTNNLVNNGAIGNHTFYLLAHNGI